MGGCSTWDSGLSWGWATKTPNAGSRRSTGGRSTRYFARQQIERWGFDPELLFLAKEFRLKTAELAVEWAHDHRSKINPLRDGLRMGSEVLEDSLERLDGALSKTVIPIGGGTRKFARNLARIEIVTTYR